MTSTLFGAFHSPSPEQYSYDDDLLCQLICRHLV
jgi:hypothetical protein